MASQRGNQKAVLGFCLTSLFSSFVLTAGLTKPVDICVYGCYDWSGHITWTYPPSVAESVDYYLQLCSPSIRLDSIYYCSQLYCNDKEVKAGLKSLNSSCQENSGLDLPSFESVALSPADLDAVQRVSQDAEVTSADEPFTQPAIPDLDWIQLSWRTDHTYYGNILLSYDLSFASYGFWGLVIAAGTLRYAIELFRSKRPHLFFERDQPASLPMRVWLWIRRRIILPAAFGQHCQEPVAGFCTLPPRLESLVILAYIVMNFIMCFPAYDLFSGNMYFPTYADQLQRYVGDRTGILSLANFSIIWVFAARNNPFIWLTGWSFSTFNRFHRWVARVAFIHAFIHSVAYSVNSFTEGGAALYDEEWPEQYWYCGVLATIFMAFMLGGAMYFVRHRYYDWFVITHVGLAVGILPTLWYHLHIYTGQYNAFIWPCVGIWVFDRLVRIARAGYASVLPRITKGVRATATYDPAAEIIRLDVTDFFPTKAVVPGTYYYLYTPGHLGHPFTLCSWWMQPRQNSASSAEASVGGDKNMSPVIEEVSDEQNWSQQRQGIGHSLLVRPYKGFTGRLRDKIGASSETNGSTKVTVFLEGPYGRMLDLSAYSDVSIITGGSGITAAISHAYYLLSASTASIHVVWAVPQSKLVDEVCGYELAAILRNERFKLEVYVTTEEVEPGFDAEKASAAVPYQRAIGRPDIYGVMKHALQKCSRNLALVSCGTPAMADDCRAAAVRLLGEGAPEMDYYDETLTW